MKIIIVSLLALLLVLSVTTVSAAKPEDKPPKDDHGSPDDKGKPDDVPKGPPDDKGKPDDVPKGPKDKTVVSGASGCVRMWITNDPTAYARCTIIDVTSPTIQQVTISKAGKTCVYVTDDLGVKMVLIGNKVLDRFNYTDWFCGFGPFDYSVVIAVDYAKNVGVTRL